MKRGAGASPLWLVEAPACCAEQHLLPEQPTLTPGPEPVPDEVGVPEGQGCRAGGEGGRLLSHVDYLFPGFDLRLPVRYDLPFVVRM